MRLNLSVGYCLHLGIGAELLNPSKSVGLQEMGTVRKLSEQECVNLASKLKA